ncbi:MAG: hypothetical protein ABEJ76_09085 [Halanaeroarchaeum sp.]
MAGNEEYPDARSPTIQESHSVEDLLPTLREVAKRPGQRGPFFCETGYGMVTKGDAALIAVSNFHDDLVVEGVVRALRERGIKVDIITYDHGQDRDRIPEDEVFTAITGLHAVDIEEGDLNVGVFESKYAEYLGLFGPAQRMAEEEEYSLIIQSVAGPIRPASTHFEGDPIYFERIPWQTPEQVLGNATTFPSELYTAINEKTFDRIWDVKNKGATVEISDPEGTHFSFTLLPEYVEAVGSRESDDNTPEYLKGHISFHPLGTPSEDADMNGVLAGTTAHYNSPFPHVEFHIDDGKTTRIVGGGRYGQILRDLHEETKTIQYPEFGSEGMLWPFEFVVGTQPKAFRPPHEKFIRHSGSGTLAERLRSGVIHIGIGTSPTSDNTKWAAENSQPYGHVHVHLLFPTVEIHRDDGEIVKIIEKGRLSVLDDPEIRNIASKYGDPDKLLREDWIPEIPGISVEGNYERYANDPITYLEQT